MTDHRTLEAKTKTALQQFIEWYEARPYASQPQILGKAKGLIDTDRSQIECAYQSGELDGVTGYCGENDREHASASDYFTSIYETP